MLFGMDFLIMIIVVFNRFIWRIIYRDPVMNPYHTISCKQQITFKNELLFISIRLLTYWSISSLLLIVHTRPIAQILLYKLFIMPWCVSPWWWDLGMLSELFGLGIILLSILNVLKYLILIKIVDWMKSYHISKFKWEFLSFNQMYSFGIFFNSSKHGDLRVY